MYIPTDQELNDAQTANNILGVDAFSIQPLKLGQVIAIVRAFYNSQIAGEKIEEFILADWHGGQEHQDWLDEATSTEIADWIIGCNPEF